MTTMSDPRWPAGTVGPRVLVECDDAAVQDGVARALREQGYSVAACAGPRGRTAGTCPLVERHRCGLVEGADVVVHALDPTDPAHRAVLASVHEHVPGLPVVDAADVPMTREPLLAAVDHAARH